MTPHFAASYEISRDGVWKVPELRAYQREAVSELQRILPQHERVVMVAPTGSGKTVIAAAFLRKMSGSRVLWIAHRIELLAQAAEHLVRAGVPVKEVGVLTGETQRNASARVLVASIDMLRTREVTDKHLIVVDEAHRVLADSYQRTIAANPGAWLLGLTATPWRLDGRGLGDSFRCMTVAGETADLAADGFLAAPLVYGVSRERAMRVTGGLKTKGGEYAHGEAERAAMSFLVGDVVDECSRLAPGEQTIVFATSRKHGRELMGRFLDAKQTVRYVDGETPSAVRDGILKDLASGEVRVVVNVDVLSEGFDCPPVKCISLARPTRSLTRFLQQCGRASRPYGQRRPIILDHPGNCWRLVLPTATRNWSLDGRAKSKRTGDAPVRQCAACQAMIAAALATCPECGAEQPRASREVTEQDELLELMRETEAERASTLARLRVVAARRGADESWCQKVLVEVFGA